MPLDQATRPVLWNIAHSWVIYVLFAMSMAIAAVGIYQRVARWRRGLPADRFDQPMARLKMLLTHALEQRRTAREKYAAIFHTSIFYGFIILFIATVIVMLDHRFGIPIMRGSFYLYFQSLIVDVFGALVVVGVGIATVRRVAIRPKKLVYTDDALWILLAIFLMSVTGFLVEGWRIAATNDPWGAWSPFGNLVAKISESVMTVETMTSAHRVMWWLHAVLVFGFLAWAPYTKMIHALTGPLNIYTARLAPTGGSLKAMDFDKLAETGEPMGVKTMAGFTWKDLLDFDACTECGRCTSVCPANTVGKSLSPRDIILDLRGFMHGNQDSSTKSHEETRRKDENDGPASSFVPLRVTSWMKNAFHFDAETPIVSAVPATAPQSLWECTTCGACMEACPVFIEQMPKIVDLRRYLVMEESDFPDTMQEAMTSLESRQHPFRGTQSTRVDWADGLDVKTMAEYREAEVLLWVGCGGALIERNQKVVRATAELLQQAGVKFAILGREEKCTGDPARRIGNEFLFEMMAKDNVETLNGYAVKTIVTSCPHCFNTFRNEYPQFGGRYEVFHHSEYLAKLVADGKLKAGHQQDKTVTFHDPCYLGRHNGVVDAPRQLVQLSAKRSVEMEMNRKQGFCCGGGGGMSFVDEPKDKRVNQERARQALETGAEIVAVGCPFCMTMLEDGINARKGDRDVKVMDVAELLRIVCKPGNT